MFIGVSDRTIRPWRKTSVSITDVLRASGVHAHFVTPFKELESTIPLTSLDSITLDTLRMIFSGMKEYIKDCKGLTAGPQLEKSMK